MQLSLTGASVQGEGHQRRRHIRRKFAVEGGEGGGALQTYKICKSCHVFSTIPQLFSNCSLMYGLQLVLAVKMTCKHTERGLGTRLLTDLET